MNMQIIRSALFAFSAAVLAAAAGCGDSSMSEASTTKPTIVLVHGAFADASSWNGVIAELTRDGYPVVAAANPLRGVAADAAQLSTVINSIEGPVVLVGHSYGGSVITQAAGGHENVQALVFVSAFEPDVGETSFGLAAHDPGATLGDALAPPVPLGDGSNDLYIDHAKFPAQFAADVPAGQAALMAVTQRPIRDAAGNEAITAAGWRTIPSWSIYGDADLNIPPRTMAFMAERANARRTVVVRGASHVVMVSHPAEVADLIEEAASR